MIILFFLCCGVNIGQFIFSQQIGPAGIVILENILKIWEFWCFVSLLWNLLSYLWTRILSERICRSMCRLRFEMWRRHPVISRKLSDWNGSSGRMVDGLAWPQIWRLVSYEVIIIIIVVGFCNAERIFLT